VNNNQPHVTGAIGSGEVIVLHSGTNMTDSDILMRQSVELSALPAVAMLLMSLLVLKLKVPTIIVAALQHLAAGIVLSAVAVELIPVINNAPSNQTWAIIVGFLLGIGSFLGLGYVLSFLDDDDEEPDEEDESSKDPLANGFDNGNFNEAIGSLNGGYNTMGMDSPRMKDLRRNLLRSSSEPFMNSRSPGLPRRGLGSLSRSKAGQARLWDAHHQLVNSPRDLPSMASLQKSVLEKKDSESDLLVTAPEQKERPVFPIMFASAVLIDALVDGFLIGVSLSAGEKGGLVMAIALTIEMAFLGMTFASAMRMQPIHIGIPATIAPPLVLVIGGVCGAALSSQAGEGTWGNTMLISFGVAALLYLVTEELLLEAHESLENLGSAHDGHVWWVDLCFFVGFLTSLCLQNIENHQGGN